MLPNPTNTGGGPASRKSTSRSGGCHPGEPAVCGQRQMVACLLQPPAQARERRNVTSRIRCHDQDAHHVSPVEPPRFSAPAELGARVPQATIHPCLVVTSRR
jgi:hypothetical protein